MIIKKKIPGNNNKKCQFNLYIPTVGFCCEAYYKSNIVNSEQNFYLNFPFCTEENCPIKNPELLKGRILSYDN